MTTRNPRLLSPATYRRMRLEQERHEAEMDRVNEETFVGFCLGLAGAAVVVFAVSGIPAAMLAGLAAYLGGGR